jgi:hypothetical protein
VTHYIKLERVFLQNHPDLDERWVQARIQRPQERGLSRLIFPNKTRDLSGLDAIGVANRLKIVNAETRQQHVNYPLPEVETQQRYKAT